MEYYEFLTAEINIGDLIETTTHGVVHVQDCILDGGSAGDEVDEYGCDTGIIFLDDDDQEVFVQHGEIIGLAL